MAIERIQDSVNVLFGSALDFAGDFSHDFFGTFY